LNAGPVSDLDPSVLAGYPLLSARVPSARSPAVLGTPPGVGTPPARGRAPSAPSPAPIATGQPV